VIQPNTTGQARLPYTEDELQKIEQSIPDEWLTSFGSAASPASLATVLPLLQTSSIIHFACHGIQDAEKPLQSALLIGGEELTVSEIMKQSGVSHNGSQKIQNHLGLAFLSACQTARGDKKLPDEAMHLAATLLFAGFRSVVATMWRVPTWLITVIWRAENPLAVGQCRISTVQKLQRRFTDTSSVM
jgi:CHAT domain-containing protein